uniref:Poly [ADP-ribose] polymerase n=1 Tax=Myripristis murdjan TaxID=586833 RepID=A0A668AN88_9TELE
VQQQQPYVFSHAELEKMYTGGNTSDDVEYMDTSDTPWCWYYLADCGRWHRFEVLWKCLFEHHYRSLRIRLCHPLIRLNELTPEYQTVADYVKKDGLLNQNIISISRIQNIDLWEMFCRKKQQFMRIKGVKEIKEGRLFHGTDKSNVDSICTYNFDLGLAGRGAHLFGKGIYFAKYAAYADKYSRGNTAALPLYGGAPQGVQGRLSKVIFLARVIIGRSKFGKSDFQKPDHGRSANDHDSCVDDIMNPKIFVIFNPNQIYPEYLIEYS